MCYSIWHNRRRAVRFLTETIQPFVRRERELGQTNSYPRYNAIRHEAVRGIPERTGKKTDGRGMKPCGRIMYGQKGTGRTSPPMQQCRAHAPAHTKCAEQCAAFARAHTECVGQSAAFARARGRIAFAVSAYERQPYTDCRCRGYTPWKTLPPVLRFPTA